jgi:small subunit ribosomal protein S1
VNSGADEEKIPSETLRPEVEAVETPDDEYVDPGDRAVQDEMDSLMDQYLDKMDSTVESGQLIRVPIVAIHRDHVLVDVGEKAEGIVAIQELTLPNGELPYKLGDPIDVIVKHQDAETGLVVLSHYEARRRVAMNTMEEAARTGAPVSGIVRQAVKGGLLVDVGLIAFMPASMVDTRRVEDFEAWVGRQVECAVLEFSPNKRRIIVSRRKLLDDRRAAERDAALSRLVVGETVEGRVKKIVDFGVFVDLGGVDGLVHRGEISWQRNVKVEDCLALDQVVQVKIVNVDRDSGKISLSRRQTLPDPWVGADEKYPVGATVRGKVVSLTGYGAFVRLEEGVDGMIHVSDMAWDSGGRRPADYIAVGQEVEAAVTGVDVEQRRISLGLKQLTADPWESLVERHPVMSRVKGKVTGLTKYGAFVEIEEGVEGMIHVSDFTWDKKVRQPKDVIDKGDEVEACILSIDRDKRRISLGVKQLSESPMTLFAARHRVGQAVEGEVSGVAEFGVFVSLAGGLEGFDHVSQLDDTRIESPASIFKVGDKIEAEITKIDENEGKIGLSRKLFKKNAHKKVIANYMKTNVHGGQNLGELLAEISLDDKRRGESRSAD